MKQKLILDTLMFVTLMSKVDELPDGLVNININSTSGKGDVAGHYSITFEIDDDDLNDLFHKTTDFTLPEMVDYTYEDFLIDHGVMPL